MTFDPFDVNITIYDNLRSYLEGKTFNMIYKENHHYIYINGIINNRSYVKNIIKEHFKYTSDGYGMSINKIQIKTSYHEFQNHFVQLQFIVNYCKKPLICKLKKVE